MCKDDVAKLVQSYFPSVDEAVIQELAEDIIVSFRKYSTCMPPEVMVSPNSNAA